MSEKSQDPTWVAELRTAIEKWHEANPETRSILAVAVGEDKTGNLTVNATIIGKHEHIVASLEAAMFDGSEDNLPGMALRIAAMGFAINHARITNTHNNSHE